MELTIVAKIKYSFILKQLHMQSECALQINVSECILHNTKYTIMSSQMSLCHMLHMKQLCAFHCEHNYGGWGPNMHIGIYVNLCFVIALKCAKNGKTKQ